MGLSMPVKSHKTPKSKSTRERVGKPQTTYSKRMVRNGVAVLEERYTKHNLAFATYTLPELTAPQMTRVRENIHEVARQLKQYIERDLIRAGLVPEVVYVIEIQEERYNTSGVVAPHLHVVFQSRKNRYSEYAIKKQRNTEIWNRVLSNVVGEDIQAPYGASIEKVKKSAERYMAKYMSKGSQMAAHLHLNGLKEQLPKSWWGMSLSLRSWIKNHMKLFSDATRLFIKDNYKTYLKDIGNSPFTWLYVHSVEHIQSHGEVVQIPVSLMGRIRPDWIDRFEYMESEH